MGKKQFSAEQIAFALRQAESGSSVAEIIRKLGISEQTFYRWKKRFAGLGFARSSFRYNSRRNQRADRHPLAERIRAAIEGCGAAAVRERAQHVSG
jgi:transposase-like protein